MSARPPGRRVAPGLCGACRFGRVVRTGRGSEFLLCERSRSDARFVRYPELPVLSCPGFEPPGANPEFPEGGRT